MMSFAEYESRDALGLAELVRKGEVTPGELLDSAIARLDEVNPRINAIAVQAVDAARAAIDRGVPAGPLSGVPFLLKDLGSARGRLSVPSRLPPVQGHTLWRRQRLGHPPEAHRPRHLRSHHLA